MAIVFNYQLILPSTNPITKYKLWFPKLVSNGVESRQDKLFELVAPTYIAVVLLEAAATSRGTKLLHPFPSFCRLTIDIMLKGIEIIRRQM